MKHRYLNLSLLLFFSNYLLQAQCLDVTLLKDVNGGINSSEISSIQVYNGFVYFGADDGVHGLELWKSDGTTDGTVMVADINTGTESSMTSNPNFTVYNGELYFRANDGSTGLEVWKTNGTELGTQLVKDINPGTNYSTPAGFYEFNNYLYFGADDGVNGRELWRTDGTEVGTVLLEDINAGTGSSSPASFYHFNNSLLFSANDGSTGTELWKTDGTSVGTVLVKDINVGVGNSSPFSFTEFNGDVYFSADDDVVGKELWKTDGTGIGTVLVKDVNVGSSNSNPSYLNVLNGVLYFRALEPTTGYELWKTDGTEIGTEIITDNFTGTGSTVFSSVIVFDGNLYFEGTDGTNGNELWKSDGTALGTEQVKDINIGSASSTPRNFKIYDNELFFSADDGIVGKELWKSDGTNSGTVIVSDIYSGVSGSNLVLYTVLDDKLIIEADDGINGLEPWIVGPCQPKIVVEGNGIEIEANDISPNLADDTDFGDLCQSESTLHNFTIKNTGSDTLFITQPIAITGSNAGDFSIVGLPADTILAAESTTFSIEFTPTGTGVEEAQINVSSDDPNFSNYIFNIQGTSLMPVTGIDIQVACDSYQWIDGNTYNESNNSATYTYVGRASNGCDSTVTLDLTINSVNVNVSVSGSTISSEATSAMYQWLDCNDNNSEISSATDQSFTPTVSGNYAVEVSENGCIDTSDCSFIDVITSLEMLGTSGINVFPNPNNGSFSIELNGDDGFEKVTIMDCKGKTVRSMDQFDDHIISVGGLSSGIYQLILISSDKYIVERVAVIN